MGAVTTINLEAIILLALGVLGAALVFAGIAALILSRRTPVRIVAAAGIAAGVVMWGLLLAIVPVSRSVTQYQDSTASVQAIQLPRLAPPEGVKAASSLRSMGEREGVELWILETDTSAAELREHYRRQMLQLGWTVRPEMAAENLEALTGTFSDELHRPWQGVLLIFETFEGRWLVSLTVARVEGEPAT